MFLVNDHLFGTTRQGPIKVLQGKKFAKDSKQSFIDFFSKNHLLKPHSNLQNFSNRLKSVTYFYFENPYNKTPK